MYIYITNITGYSTKSCKVGTLKFAYRVEQYFKKKNVNRHQ